MMEAVRRGGDRQELHEKLRVHARASAEAHRARPEPPPTCSSASPPTPPSACSRDELSAAARAARRLVGRSAEQVEIFVREELDPALAGAAAAQSAPVRV